MNLKGCRCPHCKADLSEEQKPRCPMCRRDLDVDELYAKRRIPGTIILPAGLRRFGLPVGIVSLGLILFVTTGGGGRLIGIGTLYLLVSMFWDPFD